MSEVGFPPKLNCLFLPKRYKVLYGGRGAGRTWGALRALLLIGAQIPLRVLCAREFQSSIQESVHQTLEDQINRLGLGNFYKVEKSKIYGQPIPHPDGTVRSTEFGFEGLRHNISKLKSWEGADVCLVEEAENVSRHSWNTLIPTIRKDKNSGVDGLSSSEIWINFNPQLETDATFDMFVKHERQNSSVIKMTWQDNPWFQDILREEMLELRERNYDEYLNVWEGHCRVMLEGAVYAEELRSATENNRICRVPHDPMLPVDTVWDLGFSDQTSIWFVQKSAFEYRIIDFYENQGKGLSHYLDVLEKRHYAYGTDWLPHDGGAKNFSTGKSVKELMLTQGRRPRIVPSLKLEDGINAARMVFPVCYFDAEKCADGLQSLRHYRFDVSKNLETLQYTGRPALSRKPKHDWSSHAADAFRYLAIAVKQPKDRASLLSEKLEKFWKPQLRAARPLERQNSGRASLGWMK